MTVKKTCRYCEREFEPTPGSEGHQDFCCTKCQSQYGHKGMTKAAWLAKYGLVEISDGEYEKTCRWCGKTFVTRNFQKNFCGKNCANYFSRTGKSKAEWQEEVSDRQASNRRRKHVCRYCGMEYVNGKDAAGRSLYCSKSCKTSYLLYGCDKKEHERRMASRTVELKTNSPYINGVNVVLMRREKSCLWCGETFSASYGQNFCCSHHRSLYVTHGKISKAEKEANHRKVCKWCMGTFTASRIDANFCCEAHWKKYGTLKDVMLMRITENRDGQRAPSCSRCGTRLVIGGSFGCVCPNCGAFVCSSCGRTVEFKPGDSLPELGSMCPDCLKQASDIVRKNNLNKYRLYYAAHREDILERQRIRYRSSDGYLAAIKRKRSEDERLERLSEQEEIKIQEIRAKFHNVEITMLLPPEERWQFSKDWTEEERAYAATIAETGTYDKGFGLTEDEIELGLGDFDE